MADGRKHHPVRWHHPTASTAIVSRGDEFAIRPNAAGDGLEYSYDTSAWAALSGGGGGTPGGSDTHIQYNNAGAFGGAANLTWNNAGSLLELDGRFTIEHSTASLTDWTLFSARTLTGSATSGSLAYGSFIGMIDESGAGAALGERANVLFRYQRNDVANGNYFAANVASQMLLTDTDGELASEYHGYNARVEVGDADVTLQAWTGYYAHSPFGLGLVTNARGFVAEPGLSNGLGITNPSATLHASGTVRLDLGSDATGDILYRSSGGNLARLAVGTNGHVLTLASGLPSWAAASAAPGGSNTQIQYNNAGAFGGAANFTWDNTNSLATVTGRLAVTYSTTSITTRALTSALTLTGSSIDTANLYYANLLSLTDQNTGDGSLASRANLVARYTRANVANDLAAAIGVVADMQMTSGAGTYNGAMIGFRAQVTATSGGTLTTSTGFYAQKAPLFADSITNLYGYIAESGMLNGFGTTSPTATLHVSGTTKFTLGSDATGDIWYRNSSGFFTRLGVGTNGHVLTLASGLPSWAAAAGGSPGGSNTQIQYNSSGSFAGAANFTWDNGNSLATLTGRLIITHSSATLTNRGIFVDSTLTGSNTQGSLYYANLLSLTDQSTAGTGTDERAAILFRYTRASASDDFSSAYGVVSEMLLTATSGTFTGTFTAYKAQGEIAPGTTLTTYAGYYAAYPGGFGDLTNVYGFVAEGGMNNGFGTTSPTATLHVSGTVKIDLGSDGTGDIFYRNSGGTLSRLAVGTNGHVLTLASGLPSWAAAGAGSSSWNGITNPTGNQALTMAAHTSTWTWNATTSSNNLFTITNTSNDTGTGFLVSIETPGGSNAKSPLRVSAQGSEALHVDPDGKFIWGSTANYTTLGLSSQQLAIVANGSSGLNILCAGSTSNTPRVIFHKAANTPASPQIVTSSDIIGNLQFNAFDGSIYQQAAGIQALMDGTPGANDLPAALRFLTTADGASSSSVRMIIKSTGRVGIATSTPGAMLHVNGTAQFDLGSDATGDIWYRNSSGLMTRLGVGTNGHVLTLASGLPSWAAAAGGGSPGGSNTQIQYNSSGSFAGAANFTWDNGNSIAAVTGRLSVTHSSATLTNRGAFIDSTLTGSNTQGSLYYANLISLTDQSTAGFSLDERTAMLFRYVRASSADDFSFAYGVVSEMQLTAGSGTLSTNYVAYKAMGSVASGATLSAFTGFYAESPTGSGTLTNFYGFASDPGAKHGFGISTPGYTIDAAYFPTATTGRNVLANYSVWSQGTAADGFGLSVLYKLGSTTTERLAANFDVYWQESTDASRSAVSSIATAHKAQGVTYQRQIWGAYKDLVDNTRTDIFTVTFGTSDHKAIAGTVRMTIFAKKTSGGNEVQVYKKDIPFLAAHNAATLTGFGIWGGEYGALGGVSTGSITFTFECNTTAFPSYALNANTYTFQLTANTDLASTSEFYLIYDIEMNGDIDVALLP